MENTRLRHEAAMALSRTILEVFQNLLRPEEYRDAMEETYSAVKAGLEAYDTRREQPRKHRPTQN